MRVRTLYDQKNFCDLFLINYNCVWKDAKLGITIVCSFISTKVQDGIFLFPIDSCKIIHISEYVTKIYISISISNFKDFAQGKSTLF